MLVTPLDRPFEWKDPPRLALGLCLVLLLIFIPWHIADMRLEKELAQKYRETLLTTEWPLYETHALKTGQRSRLQKLKADYAAGKTDSDKLDSVALYIAMDNSFVQSMQLHGQDYLSPENFDAWKKARADFDPARSKLSTLAIGIDPQEFRPITFLTFGLVQADTVQLLAAILLLLTTGIAVELGRDSGVLLAGYLGGGVTGAIVFLLTNGNDVQPLCGASVGAAAVVGIYLMHFRTTKVRFFNRYEWPAYVLAGLWLALVALEFFLSPLRLSEVFARVAALASGPLWLMAHEKWFVHATDYMPVIVHEEEEDKDLPYREQLHQALEATGRLDFASAQKQLREMLKAYPSDLRVLTQLYHIEKLNPASPAYDAVARRLFGLNAADSDHIVIQIYRDYLRFSDKKTALDIDTSLKLVLRFTRMNEVMEADKLMRMVLERKTPHALIGKTASALADALDRLQEPSRARFFRQVAAQ